MSLDDLKDEAVLAHALELFGLAMPFTRETLEAKRRELLATWHPHRYASLTNNPRKYMEMYRRGEAMTKDLEAAYAVLVTWLRSQGPPAGDGV